MELKPQPIENFGQSTLKSIQDLYYSDKKTVEPIWRTSWPLFNEAIVTLDSGLCTIMAPENIGKTNFAVNVYKGILKNTPNSIVADIVIDDAERERIRQIAASHAGLSIRNIALPSLLEEGDKKIEQRRDAYRELLKNYRGRYEIVEGSKILRGGRASTLNGISNYAADLRATFPTNPLWICIDALDNVRVEKDAPGRDNIETVSKQLTEVANEYNILFFCTKHQNKYNRGRGASTDASKGSGDLQYDAKLIIIGYSEVAELGQNASLYFNRKDKPETEKSPIFEARFGKNKAGDFKKTIYYYQFSDFYQTQECDEETQGFYQDLVRSKSE